MKVNIIKDHPNYPLGEVDVSEERANYLLRINVATLDKEKVDTPKKAKEKIEHQNKKEKVKK